VVLGSDLHASVIETADRVVASMMAEREFVRASTYCQAQNLMAEANAEQGDFPDDPTQGLCGLDEGLGVARSVGDEDPHGMPRQDIGRSGEGRDHIDVEAPPGEIRQDVLLHPEIDGYHETPAVAIG
jgi:hypothetical protein